MMASANLSRQRQDPLHALSAFAQASTVAGSQDHGVAETLQYAAADEEGRQINDKVSIVPEASFAPSLEDINVYTLDAKILKITNPALLPPPRHSFQSLAESHYRVQLGNLPAITGFVGQSMTAGRLLYPERRRGSGPQHLRHDFQRRNYAGSAFRNQLNHIQRRPAVYCPSRHDLTGVHESESVPAVSLHLHQFVLQLDFGDRQRECTRLDRSRIRTCIPAMPPPTLNSPSAGPGAALRSSPDTRCAICCFVPWLRSTSIPRAMSDCSTNSATA